MAIKTVQAVINGQTYNLTLMEGETKKYKATPTAPGDSSFNLEGGYYPVQVKVENTAGNTAEADHNHSTLGANLRLYAKEQQKPVITILEPTNDAYVTSTSKPVVRFKVVDNNTQTSGYSGVKKDSLVLKVNGNVIDNSKVEWTDTEGGYIGTYIPETDLANGEYTVSVDCSDNDGNAAATATATFTIDTAAPSLDLTSPEEGFETKATSIEVKGVTNDEHSKPVRINITLNGVDQGDVTVSEDGSFSKVINFTQQGANVIEVTATDSAGLVTKITRNVVFDTTAPVIKSVTIDPNPVYCGTVYEIIVEVE